MASTQLTRSISSTGNRKTATFSAWVKKCDPTKDTQVLINFGGSYSIYLHQAGLRWNDGSGNYWYTNALQRDTNGFYHIVIAIDTTQATASDRVKGYINGVQETSLLNSSYPSQNADLNMNVASTTNYIGNDNSGTGYFDGIMSHVHWIDGTAYNASAFGSTDSTTGEWKINTSPSVTYGTNGFFILKDGNSVTDQSGNGNNFTVGAGTLTKTEDNPSNVFATLNAIDNYYASATYSNGNLSITTDTSKYAPSYSTLGVSSGKYYAECKMTAGSSARIGIISRLPQDTGATSSPGNDAYSVGYYSVSGDYYKGSNATSYGNSYTNGDIIGIAMDLDNNRLFFSKNGTWQNSGDPTSSTGAITIPTSYSGFYHFAVSDQHDGENAGFTWNFGNGYFGTTAVSSAGTNASGLGIFEYDVPSGYTALCTKGLNL